MNLEDSLKTWLNVTVCLCNNKCSFGGSVDTPNLMHFFQFRHQTGIYLWYSSQVDSKLHIPIALSQISVVWLDMIHIDMLQSVTYWYVTKISICYSIFLQQQVRFLYLSRYTKSDAHLPVFTVNWHIPMVFFPSGSQTAHTYSTFSDLCTLTWYATICYSMSLQQQVPFVVPQSIHRISCIFISFGIKLTYTYGILLKWTPNCIYL